jgi:hypothetical protein
MSKIHSTANLVIYVALVQKSALRGRRNNDAEF